MESAAKTGTFLEVFRGVDEVEVLRLAAVGLSASRIAAALGLEPRDALRFIALAEMPGSCVARIIEEGRANGTAAPQLKLQEVARAGNIDAIKTLQKIQGVNRFNELLTNMDDDELSLQTIQD